jgi:TatD DNase family protein
MRWFDTHCHLDRLPAEVAVDMVLQRAVAAGVRRILVPGVAGAVQVPAAVSVAENIKIATAWGVHPDFVAAANGQIGAIPDWKNGHTPVAIGECGLDRRLALSIDRQEEVFGWQLQIARAYDLPVIVHLVGHGQRALQMLQSAALSRGFIIHSYSGSPEMAAEFVAAGGFISLSAASLRNREKLQKMLALVPLSRLLLETDAPDMPLPGWSEKYNEPAAVAAIGAQVAEICGLPVEKLAEVVYTNALRIFALKDE